MRSNQNYCLGIFLIFLQISFIFGAIVRIKDGLIEGWEDRLSRKSVAHYSFLGIPYAEAPKANLRFQPPVKKQPWEGTLNALNFSPMCMQPVNRGETWPIDEDCLTLNVFTKSISNTTALKPVIVYIHGGAFLTGGSVNHGPNYFMDRDVVLVTINYRVGAFGFLATGTEKAMGNMGLKDQVMALKWVQDNIEVFRGDPQKVTVTGLSAGGFSVSSLLASDMAQNLFQRVIIVSGSITWMTRMHSDYKELAQQLAKEVNCGNATDIVECMQGVPAHQIVAANVIPGVPCGTGVSMVWNPVIEGDFNQEKFFSKNPIEVFKDSPQTRFNNIQIMIGITEHEIIYAAPVILSDQQMRNRVKNDLAQLVYDCFYTAKVPSDISLARQMYLPLDEIDQRSFDGIGKFCSDGIIGYGSHRLVHYLSNFTDVYYYKFNYAGQASVFNWPRTSPYGITHADDIQYLFYTWYVDELMSETHPDAIMVERMTRLWEQFATTGNPNNNTDVYLKDMIWPKHDSINEFYLEIGTHLVEKQGLLLERFAVWDKLTSGSNKVHHLNILLIGFISILFKSLW